MAVRQRALLLLAATAALAAGEREKATGINFKDKVGGLQLVGTGVRTKGPIKVYAAGLYVAPMAAKVSALRKYKGQVAKDLGKGFYKDLLDTTFAKCVVLKMAMGVSSEKLVGALSDSVKPRMRGDVKALEPFKVALLDGCAKHAAGGKASKGTELCFGLNGDKMSVQVNGKKVGVIKSGALCKALVSCYLDDNAVSPGLKRSCCEGVLKLL